MNNFKKIGLTALAGSLVATSVYAGEMSVAGSASWRISNHAGTEGGKTMAMGNQLTFTGSGEMDNGMNVALSFILDQGDNTVDAEAATTAAGTGGPFDSHSITISSDAMGSVVFAGEGASSAQNTIDTTAAGDIWDNTFTGYTAASNASAGTKTLTWTLPSMVDGLGVVTSYNGSSAGEEGTIGYALTYTGVEGLSVSYGVGDATTGVSTTEADATTMKASYAYGSFTVAYSNNDYQSAVASSDQETTSYKLSYTVSDAISISYGEDTIDLEGSTADAEYDKLSASYTSGGMTVTATQASATDALHGTTTAEDQDYWSLGLSFAF